MYFCCSSTSLCLVHVTIIICGMEFCITPLWMVFMHWNCGTGLWWQLCSTLLSYIFHKRYCSTLLSKEIKMKLVIGALMVCKYWWFVSRNMRGGHHSSQSEKDHKLCISILKIFGNVRQPISRYTENKNWIQSNARFLGRGSWMSLWHLRSSICSKYNQSIQKLQKLHRSNTINPTTQN